MRYPQSHLLAVAAFILTSAAEANEAISFEPISSTPYDVQIARVEQFIRTNAANPGDDIPTLEQVNRWMRQLHAIRYEYSTAWKTPDEMQRTGAGDCKAKAVSLYYLMRAYGAKNVLLVIGRKTSSSRGTHAWLVWKYRGSTFILDPTTRTTAFEVKSAGNGAYLTHYAYSGGKRYRPVAGYL